MTTPSEFDDSFDSLGDDSQASVLAAFDTQSESSDGSYTLDEGDDESVGEDLDIYVPPLTRSSAYIVPCPECTKTFEHFCDACKEFICNM